MTKNMYKRICKQCKCEFIGGPRAWYCPKCRIERKKNSKKEYEERKKRGQAREIGGTYVCEICGKPYILTGGLQKYCNECAVNAVKEVDRKQGLEYYNSNKQKINPKRNQKRRKKIYCKICGKKIVGSNNQEFCKDHKQKYKDVRVDTNIIKRNNSYIVKIKGKYIKSTKDLQEAIKIRDLIKNKEEERKND